MNPMMDGVMGVAQGALDARYADSASDQPDSAARTGSGESTTGWEPQEVWLRRILQPRRRRTNGESSRD
jgi:hypothetical protein